MSSGSCVTLYIAQIGNGSTPPILVCTTPGSACETVSNQPETKNAFAAEVKDWNEQKTSMEDRSSQHVTWSLPSIIAHSPNHRQKNSQTKSLRQVKNANASSPQRTRLAGRGQQLCAPFRPPVLAPFRPRLSSFLLPHITHPRTNVAKLVRIWQ